MKRQTVDQLRQKSKAELTKDVAEARRELVAMRMQQGQQMVTNVKAKGVLRRRIAVLETLIGLKD